MQKKTAVPLPGQLLLGEGRPKIIVPLTDATPEALRASAGALLPLVEAGLVDMAEWRADHLLAARENNWEALLAAASTLREAIPAVPILFTVRTAAEGGQADMPFALYASILEKIAEEKLADMIDVEVLPFREKAPALIARLRAMGVPVVASSHDFAKTDPAPALLERLRILEATGADVLKLAVMPACTEDVMALLTATKAMAAQTDRPLITMSMGERGRLSRLVGELFGSAATFATAGAASAPGQLSAQLTAPLLRQIHEALSASTADAPR